MTKPFDDRHAVHIAADNEDRLIEIEKKLEALVKIMCALKIEECWEENCNHCPWVKRDKE